MVQIECGPVWLYGVGKIIAFPCSSSLLYMVPINMWIDGGKKVWILILAKRKLKMTVIRKHTHKETHTTLSCSLTYGQYWETAGLMPHANGGLTAANVSQIVTAQILHSIAHFKTTSLPVTVGTDQTLHKCRGDSLWIVLGRTGAGGG